MAFVSIIAILVVLAIIFVVVYNNLVKLRNRVDNAWSQIEVQMQRRADLIPNLVETVKGYAAHEVSTFQAVTDARAAVMSAKTVQDQAAAESALSSSLRTLFAVAEQYPQLMASANFKQLQTELANTEDKVSYMRQSYNDTVMKFNTAIQTFPAALIAGPVGFAPRPMFDSEPGAAQTPTVRF